MAGNPERDSRGIVERAGTGVRNFGIFAAMIGIIAAILEAPIGGTIFWGGTAVGLTGEAARRAAGSGKK